MGDLIFILILLFSVILAFVISALPLYFAVKFLGGKTSILKTIIIMVISGIIISAIRYKFTTFGAIIAFFILIWIYHEAFRLKWWKALFVWVVQFLLIILLYLFFGFGLAIFLGMDFLSWIV